MVMILAVLLVAAIFFLWALNVVGLPGNWLIVAAAALYGLVVAADSRLDISWWGILTLLCLAALGEVIEFAASAFGVKRAGGSRRGAVLAMAGALAGGALGLVLGTPIPLIGSFLGALLFAGLGAAAGAVLGEQWRGQGWDKSLRIGRVAFWARLLGTSGKTVVGAVMVLVVLVALCV